MPKSETATLLKSLDHRFGQLDERVGKLDESVNILDHRVVNIEQILPALATKKDLERFATKEELREGLREEGERSRRYVTMIAEELRDTVNRALDGNIGHTQRLDEHGGRLDGHDASIGAVDVRVTAIERTPRRGR